MRKGLCICLFLLLACTAFVGATGTSEKTAASTASSDVMTPYGRYPELIEYSVGHSAEGGLPEGVTLENNDMVKLIQEKLNVKTKIAWAVPWDQYDQKVALCISSGDVPDFLRVNTATFKQMVAGGMVADISESFKKCLSSTITECYASYPPSFIENVSVDGKIMAIPGAVAGQRVQMCWIRYDWLTQLGLKEPTSMEDVFEIARQFVKQKPNGKVDIGINMKVGDYGPQTMYPIFHSFGAYPEIWQKGPSGKVFYGSIAPEMKAALSRLNALYKEGLLGMDLGNRTVEMLIGAFPDNTTGVFFYDFWGPDYPLNKSRKTDPTADWRPYLIPSRADGKTVGVSVDSSMTHLVVRKGYSHPEVLPKVWSVQYDTWRGITEEGKKLFDDWTNRGITWTLVPLLAELEYNDHYSREGKAVREALKANSDKALPASLKAFFPLVKEAQANPKGPAFASQVAWSAYTTYVLAKGDVYLSPKVEHMTPAFYGVTPTMETKWATLKTMEEETVLRIIVGDKPLSAFDTFVADWKKLGGDEITAEVQKAVGK